MQRRENASSASTRTAGTSAQIQEYASPALEQPKRPDISKSPNGKVGNTAIESKQETPAMSLPASDPPERRRVVIENVTPQVDGGRYAVKRVAGDSVRVEADVYAEGHDEITVLLMYRAEAEVKWRSVEMRPGYDARWYGNFSVAGMGNYYFTVMAWPDKFRSWRRDLEKRVAAEQDVQLELVIGAGMM